ncbi:HNH endonuclease signature motif containing protein [Xenorhabdus bovienii]|uniref:Putative phage protein n=1 Tax=Xenorhabdus bovienii TaxID=40576 RepID=A0A0B6X7D3_XENBV|nr:HNH endonuclease signature motif containing protein [Xenorhabdus bovienii]CDM88229.1 Putative phage protein [Xenorhabdus bovienii]
MAQFKYTDKMKNWMRIYYGLPVQELTAKFNEHFSVNYSSKSIHGFRRRLGLRTGRTGQYPKGHISHNAGTKGLMKRNSGSFKSGSSPHNMCPIGTERISKDGYVYIKVDRPNIWRLKHRMIWEEHHGKLPAGAIVIFKDGNQKNYQIDNLLMVTRRENVILNKFYPNTPAEYKQTTTYLARIMIAINNKERVI